MWRVSVGRMLFGVTLAVSPVLGLGACGGDDTGGKDTLTPPGDTTGDSTGDSFDTSKDTGGDTSDPGDTSEDVQDTGPGDTTADTSEDVTGDTTPGDTTADTSEDVTGDTTSDTTGDTSEDTTGDTTSDTTSDTGGDTAEVVEPCSGDPLEAGCACSGDAQCDSGFCAIGPEGGTCIATCSNDGECGDGEKCVTGPGGGDGVCLVPSDFLCLPCSADADCRAAGGTNRCLSFGAAGSFCGTTCSVDSECADGFGCLQGQCVPDSGSCDCTDVALELGASTTCTVTNGFGTCSGQRFCGPGGLTACNARTPAQDICNGVDDDCDSVPDNGAGICNDGNPCTRDECGGLTGCVYVPQAGSCDDGNGCTAGDMCVNGLCEGGDSICACQTDADCESQRPASLDSECVTPTCNTNKVCDFPTKAGSCSDDDACTTGDVCDAGACKGTAKDCDDDNPCTDDSCNASGQCVNTPRTGSCEDGDACTTNDTCEGGTCVGQELDCSSLDDACHVGICDGAGGCVAQTVTCGVSGIRMHVPAASFSRKGTGNIWLKGSAGHAGPVGRSSNGIHTIHFGFHPGVYR